MIKFRFSEEIIEKLLLVDFSQIEATTIEENIDIMYETINDKNIDSILKYLIKKPEAIKDE